MILAAMAVPCPYHHPQRPKMSTCLLVSVVVGSAPCHTFTTTRNQQKRARVCSFSVVVGSAPCHALTTTRNDRKRARVCSFSVVAGSAPCHALTTTHNQRKQAHGCSFSLVVGPAPQHLALPSLPPTTNENEHVFARFRWWILFRINVYYFT